MNYQTGDFMQTTMPKIKQRSFLYPDLMDQLNPKHPLMILSKKIPWECFDEEFAENYTDFGRPAKPTRNKLSFLKRCVSKKEKTKIRFIAFMNPKFIA